MVAIDYTLTPTATPTTSSWAVSGSVLVNNVQPGILNIARLMVQLSTGQTAIPTCALTSPYVASDGLVWGGANAAGSLTTTPFAGTPFAGTGGPMGTIGVGNVNSAVGVGVGVNGVVGGIGSFTQFVLPEFTSAICRFNITLGNQVRLERLLGGLVGWGLLASCHCLLRCCRSLLCA
jgi:hypothetical protein